MTTKEIEDWIEENIPDYEECYEDYQAEFCEEGFEDGARLMAEHLQSQLPSIQTQNRIISLFCCWQKNNDGFIEFPNYLEKHWNDDDK